MHTWIWLIAHRSAAGAEMWRYRFTVKKLRGSDVKVNVFTVIIDQGNALHCIYIILFNLIEMFYVHM